MCYLKAVSKPIGYNFAQVLRRKGKMQIPSRFSIAIHICLCVEFFSQDSSFNANTDKKHCKKMTGEE